MSNRSLVLLGWVLFLASSIGFLVSSLSAGDAWAVGGSLFFLIACVVFLIPFFREGR